MEWIDDGSVWREREIPPGRDVPDLSFLSEWTTPVLAWPFWPGWNLVPGLMRPSGALFPWDVSGGSIALSWEGGVDAFFWKGLAGVDHPSVAAAGRLPWRLDWPRFRELIATGNIPETVRRDLWLADWEDISRRTVQSGFDSRRIVSRKFTELVIPDLGGYWIGSSPFAPPLDAPSGGPLWVTVSDTPDTWVSPGGVLRCSAAGWVWYAKP